MQDAAQQAEILSWLMFQMVRMPCQLKPVNTAFSHAHRDCCQHDTALCAYAST